MTTIDQAKSQGYTKELMMYSLYHDLHILVQEGQDLDDIFSAYDTENEEWITVYGYNCTFEGME